MDSPRIYIFSNYTTTATAYTTTGLTQGNSYVSCRIPQKNRREVKQDLDVAYFPDKEGQIFRWDTFDKNVLTFEGEINENTFESCLNVKATWERYFNKRMGQGTTPEGLVFLYSTGNYDKTYDDDDNLRQAYRGALEGYRIFWNDDDNLSMTVSGDFKVVWT